MSATNPVATPVAPGFDATHADSIPAGIVHWAADRSKKIAAAAFGIGILGTGATLAGVASNPGPALGSYLVAYMLLLSVALGGLFFVILHHIVGARWSVTVRRLAEGVMGTLPLFAVLFIPIVFGMKDLFMWARPEVVATDHLVQDKAGYLNTTFFLIRAVFYFAVWCLSAMYFARRSAAQDGGNGMAETKRMRAASPPALALYGLTISFAAFDWLMSLSPHWFSTIFGVYYFAGALQAILALLIILVLLLQRGGLLVGVVTVEHLHDLGKLLFGFTVFFAYIAFCQYFLIWYANIPEETFWYLERWGEWKGVSLSLVFLTFVIPFLVLLSRSSKRNNGTLLLAATVVLVGRAVDMYWLIVPSVNHANGIHAGPSLDWTTVTALIGIGGLFVGMLVHRLGKSALIPVGDPYLRNSLGHENV